MIIGVKFCGGCNEGYDRGTAFETLKDHFGNRVKFEYANEESKYGALLLMSGCTNRCASIDQYSYGGNLVSIWKADKVNEAIEEIETYLKKEVD